MADRNPGQDENREIRNPKHEEDPDQIGAPARRSSDAELEEEDDEEFEDDEETDDDQEQEDVE